MCSKISTQPHKCIFIEGLILLPTLQLSQRTVKLRKLKSHTKRVRDELATPLERTNILCCSGLSICSLLTKTWELPVSSPQNTRLACLCVHLMIFKGDQCFKASFLLNPFLLKQNLFIICQAWAFVYCFIPSTLDWNFSVSYCLLPISFYIWSLFITVREK